MNNETFTELCLLYCNKCERRTQTICEQSAKGIFEQCTECGTETRYVFTVRLPPPKR